jgi:predicted nuclease with TOPRIM domain
LHPNRGRKRKRGDGMPKKHIANHFAEWMKRIEEAQQQIKQKMDEMDGEDLKERLSDLESNYEDLDSRHEELYSRHEELRGCADRLATFHTCRFSELLTRIPIAH